MARTEPDFDPTQHRVQLDGIATVAGLRAPLTIRRDTYGIPHVEASCAADAWFGQGFAAAQDRLWQMEYDRRRACGRWAEAAGEAAITGDVLGRRLQLARSARADLIAMSAETRAMFEAYADGVNAFLQSGQPLPLEYELTGLKPEPWEPWHSIAAYKIRHVLMGVWQQKLAQARLLALVGPEVYGQLDQRPPTGSPVILPPHAGYAALFEQSGAEIAAAAVQLGFLAEVEAGSNSWAVHGSRTTTGLPMLCNDSHRALDVPSVYWQAHVTCPEFDVIGATFPGLPAFPHFGHNGSVAWSITHTSADYQDLYIEQFDPQCPGRYQTPAGWAMAEQATESIAVRGAASVAIETWRTRHGPVVHGDPRRGLALSLRYTATDGPCCGFEPLRLMLQARTVGELHESQRQWVDPVNNLVSADTGGNVGYLTRGYLPIRSSMAHRQFPTPGWTGENEWIGRVSFEQLPQAINPPEGMIVTANQAVVPGDEPYIAHQFAPPSRAERIVELLSAQSPLTPSEIAEMQADVTSVPARSWSRLLQRFGPFDSDAERARAMLAGWTGSLDAQSARALLYACFRRRIAEAIFRPIVGDRAWDWLSAEVLPPTGRMVGQWLARIITELDGRCTQAVPDGRRWESLLPDVLRTAWADAQTAAGSDPAYWRWGGIHTTNAQHSLAGTFPRLALELNPARISVGGDSDTIQCAAYRWRARSSFDITALSVYRQVVDLSRVTDASFVIPAGASGQPGSPHYGDQLPLWQHHERIAMYYALSDVQRAAEHTLTLRSG